MKTEYKYGLGRDRRELSKFQTAEWCQYIAELPRHKPDLRGENQANAKIKQADVMLVRSFEFMPRNLAKEIAERLRITTSYVYQLRRKINGVYMKWPHVTGKLAGLDRVVFDDLAKFEMSRRDTKGRFK